VILTTTWQTVSNLERFNDDVMGSALGAATNPRTLASQNLMVGLRRWCLARPRRCARAPFEGRAGP
jgi:hypothetical protein